MCAINRLFMTCVGNRAGHTPNLCACSFSNFDQHSELQYFSTGLKGPELVTLSPSRRRPRPPSHLGATCIAA